MNNILNLMKEAIHFVGISGIGWILDMVVYIILLKIGIKHEVCNIISSICGVTFVFFMSTNRIFKINLQKLTLIQKYIIYTIYQVIMILLASKCIVIISMYLQRVNFSIINEYSGILAKICVTPFTMMCNFIFMKILSEL